ncbi:MAG: lamin tail domain-containing protein [Candidatus Saccharibacteria bacterium]|nr:lamin tail domain-containing protein [Candidatus Saccharibacteria bacterium]
MKMGWVLGLATVFTAVFLLPVHVAADTGNTTATTASNILVSEVQNRGVVDGETSGSREFIELYNPTEETVSLDGWQLVFYNASGSVEREVATFEDDADTEVYYEISPDSFFVVSHEAFLPDADFILDSRSVSGYLNYNDGTVRLFNAQDEPVDLMGYGDPEGFNTNPAPAPEEDESLSRCFDENGIVRNTGDNSVDFLINDAPLPGEGIECPDAVGDPDDDNDETSGDSDDPDDESNDDNGDDSEDPDSSKDNDDENEDTENEPPANTCEKVRLSEIGAYLDEQFIEVYNTSDEAVSLKGCQLQTNRSDETYVFGDKTMELQSYSAVLIENTELTLTKTTTGTVYVLSEDGSVEVDEQYYEDLKSETSWAWFGDGQWEQTFTTTPGGENVRRELRPCPEGKKRHPETRRCRTIETEESSLKPCDPDQERNPETNRCRKIDAGSSDLEPCGPGRERNPSTNRCRSIGGDSRELVPCDDDQERNPETNRCRLINSTSELKPCGEGRERNPETNRCRNVASASTVSGMDVRDVASTNTGTPTSWWFAGFMVAFATAYGLWEWRYDIKNLGMRLNEKFSVRKPGSG